MLKNLMHYCQRTQVKNNVIFDHFRKLYLKKYRYIQIYKKSKLMKMCVIILYLPTVYID